LAPSAVRGTSANPQPGQPLALSLYLSASSANDHKLADDPRRLDRSSRSEQASRHSSPTTGSARLPAVGFANSGGLVFVDESTEEIPTLQAIRRVHLGRVAARGWQEP
jgi:hypothetical protein